LGTAACLAGSIIGSLPDDQSRRALAAYVGPSPLQKDTESQASFGQELDMYKSPHEPRHIAAQLDSRTLQNREIPTHDSKIAFVENSEIEAMENAL
jgi:hypothetical protein